VSVNNEFLLDRAKEVLELAHTALPSENQSKVLLGAICIEIGDLNHAGLLLGQALQSELPSISLEAGIDSLEGYESDRIVPVPYLIYVLLALLRMRQNAAISARRLLRLAVRSMEDEILRGDLSIPLGRPKRGAVVCLARAAIHFFERGMPLIAQSCSTLATESNVATSKKATAKNMPADSPPAVRHLLKYAECLAHLHSGRVADALAAAEESANVSNEPQHQADGQK
jgi:hypothetical protein